jgi:hypothetical protein
LDTAPRLRTVRTGRRAAAELETTREQLAALREEVRERAESVPEPAPLPEAEAPPAQPPAPDAVARALRRAIRADIGQVDSIAKAVDVDLGNLEEDVDDQAAQLAEVEDAVEDLSVIVNNHADLLDQMAEHLLVLDHDTELVHDLQGTLRVKDGQIQIVDANLVLVQGRHADGRPKGNGRLFTQSKEGGP